MDSNIKYLLECAQSAFCLESLDISDAELINLRDWSGDSLLHVAVVMNNMICVRYLCDAGIEINAAGDLGYTALHCAADMLFDDIYDFLIRHGADTTIRDALGSTPEELRHERKIEENEKNSGKC